MADDLKQIATQIQKDREKGITNQDLEKFISRLKQEEAKNKVDPKMLAALAAKGTASSIASKFPKPNEVVRSIINANPIFRVGLDVFSKLTSPITKLLSDADDQRKQEISKLLGELEGMKENLAPKETTQQTLEGVDKQNDILSDILEEIKIISRSYQDQTSSNELSNLQKLDKETVAAPTQGNDKTNSLLKKMLAVQEKGLLMSILGSAMGMVKGIGSTLAGIIGGVGAGGIVGMLSKVGGLFTRLLGPIGLVIGAAYELYEGFMGADKFFGKDINMFDKIRYAAVHLLSTFLAPVDWLVEKFTGNKSDIRGAAEKKLIEFQDIVLSYLKIIYEPIRDAFGWIADKISQVFGGITLDTKLVDIPGMMFDNIYKMFVGAWGDLVALDLPGKITSAVGDFVGSAIDTLTTKFEDAKKTIGDFVSSIPDAFVNGVEVAKNGVTTLVTSIIDSIKSFFSNMLTSFLDTIKEKAQDLGILGIGDKIAEKIESIKKSMGLGDEEPVIQPANVTYPGQEYVQKVPPLEDLLNKNGAYGDPKIEALRRAAQARYGAADRNGTSQVMMPADQSGQSVAPAQVQVNAPVTTTSSTTVVKREMQTYPQRELVPNW